MHWVNHAREKTPSRDREGKSKSEDGLSEDQSCRRSGEKHDTGADYKADAVHLGDALVFDDVVKFQALDHHV